MVPGLGCVHLVLNGVLSSCRGLRATAFVELGFSYVQLSQGPPPPPRFHNMQFGVDLGCIGHSELTEAALGSLESRFVGSGLREAWAYFKRDGMKPAGWASTQLQEENWTLSLADLETIFDECEERGFNCRHFRRFVETGTFLGQTVVALAAHFDELHTIEVDSKLFEAAKLASWKAAHPIHFHLGHSAHVLEKILPGLMGPAVFYLDAHYSGSVTGGAFSEVPLLEELVVLERQFMHAGLVVIDDMDLFSKVNFFERVSGKTGKSCGERASDWRPISCQSICRCFAAERVQRSFPTRSGNRYILCLGATASGKDSEPQLNTACLTYGAACPDLAWRSYGASHWLSVPGHPLNLDGLRRLRAEGPWWSSIADAMETEPGPEQKIAHPCPRLGIRSICFWLSTLPHNQGIATPWAALPHSFWRWSSK